MSLPQPPGPPPDWPGIVRQAGAPENVHVVAGSGQILIELGLPLSLGISARPVHATIRPAWAMVLRGEVSELAPWWVATNSPGVWKPAQTPEDAARLALDQLWRNVGHLAGLLSEASCLFDRS